MWKNFIIVQIVIYTDFNTQYRGWPRLFYRPKEIVNSANGNGNGNKNKKKQKRKTKTPGMLDTAAADTHEHCFGLATRL